MTDDSLQPLITRCPTCRTRFRVTEAQLEVAAGRVRCGACLSVFAGLEHLVFDSHARRSTESANSAIDALIEELRADPAVEQGRAARAAATHSPVAERTRVEPLATVNAPVGGTRVANPSSSPAPPVAPRSKGESLPASDAAPRATEVAQQPPEEAPPRRDSKPAREAARTAAAAIDLDIAPEDLLGTPRRRRRWWVPLALLLGVTLLTAQVLYLQFDAWAKNPQLRPVYAWLCGRLGCQLPVLRALDRIYSKNLVVRANPDAPGALLVDALIVNQAPFPQPFPELELRFSAVGGSLVSARRFRPDEYLAGELKGATLIAPMTPVHIALEVADPGSEAVNYVMVFR